MTYSVENGRLWKSGHVDIVTGWFEVKVTVRFRGIEDGDG